MKKYKNKIIIALLILITLGTSYFYGGDFPSDHGWGSEKNESTKVAYNDIGTTNLHKSDPENLPQMENDEKNKSSENNLNTTNTSQSATDVAQDKKLTCTLSVRCDTIVNNNLVSDEKKAIIPKDGIILSQREVVFYEGESVFDLLRREMMQNKIHMEFVMTPGYNTAYIEGINNLYEFDAGELSGWVYKVNGIVPSYGCSQYIIKNDDNIEWIYSCNMGKDVS